MVIWLSVVAALQSRPGRARVARREELRYVDILYKYLPTVPSVPREVQYYLEVVVRYVRPGRGHERCERERSQHC
jgi:hypothetical protein